MRLIDADKFLERVLPLCQFPEILKAQVDQEPTADPTQYLRDQGYTIIKKKPQVKRLPCPVCNRSRTVNKYRRMGMYSFACECGFPGSWVWSVSVRNAKTEWNKIVTKYIEAEENESAVE